MNAKTLDGKTYEWKIPERIAKGNKNKTSHLHQTAKMLLRAKYPNIEIYEEVPIRITGGRGRRILYLDFYLPSFLQAIEVNGQQHYSFNSMFHDNQMEFLKGKTRDAEKIMWCEINDIDLVILKYDEISQWETQI